jgi:DNA-binding GntR family transcriptional regulator
MRTDWSGDGPLYEHVANLIRQEIAGGRFTAGMALPSETVLSQAYGVSRSTVRDALQALKREGLITVRHGVDAQVRAATEHQPVTLRPGDEAIARMPSPAERRRLNLDEGIPVIEIRNGDGVRELHAASEVALQVA